MSPIASRDNSTSQANGLGDKTLAMIIPPAVISTNLTWLKLAAMLAMFFDHAVVGYLQSHHLSVYTSAWRLPGRISIPIFGFLIAYSYRYYSHNKAKFVARLWIFAVISEPIYQLYFGQPGNILLPLALAVTVLFLRERMPDRIGTVALWALAGISITTLVVTTHEGTFLTMSILVWAFSRYFNTRHPTWLVLATAMVFLSNRIGAPEYVIIVFTLSVLLISTCRDFRLPPLHLNKWAMYLFYPGHLFLLWLVSYLFKR